jgi:hypothetical protein
LNGLIAKNAITRKIYFPGQHEKCLSWYDTLTGTKNAEKISPWLLPWV